MIFVVLFTGGAPINRPNLSSNVIVNEHLEDPRDCRDRKKKRQEKLNVP